MTKAELLEYIDGLDDDCEIDTYELERIEREIEREKAQARDEYIEMLEERQEASGFYAFQDTMAMWRFER